MPPGASRERHAVTEKDGIKVVLNFHRFGTIGSCLLFIGICSSDCIIHPLFQYIDTDTYRYFPEAGHITFMNENWRFLSGAASCGYSSIISDCCNYGTDLS